MLNVFIWLPSDRILGINEEAEFDVFIEELSVLIDRIDCEQDVKLWGNEANITKFSENLETVSYIHGFKGIPANLILDNIRDVKDSDYSAFIWIDSSEKLREDEVSNDIAKNIVTLFNSTENLLFVNFEKTLSYHRSYLSVISDKEGLEKPIFVCIPIVLNFEELDEWFKDKFGTERKFNFNANHHNANHRDYNREKTIIIGSEAGKEKLSALLKSALSDKKGRERIGTSLVNFDGDNKCFVWFEYENTNNLYHGYHLTLDESQFHGRDEESIKKIIRKNKVTIDEIPERVKRILEYRNRTNAP